MIISLRPRLELLPPAESDRLHQRSVERLWEPGVQLGCGQALDLLAAHDCTVDWVQQVARIPAALVDQAVATAPRTVRLAGRDPACDLALDGQEVHFAFGSPRLADAGSELLGLADALAGIEIVSAGSADRPDCLAAVWANTGKHLRLPMPGPTHVPRLLEMADMVAGGQAVSDRGATACAVSVAERPALPLRRDGAATMAAMALAQHGIPIVICPQAGPDMAGAQPIDRVVAANAGFLASAVLYQCVQPGAPLIYGLSPTAYLTDQADLSCLLLAIGLARRYDLPLSVEGLPAAAADLGPQCGWQGALTAALAVLAGADEVEGAGLLASGQGLSPEKAVHDAEQARQLRRLARGVAFDDERLMAGAIERVGIGGHYLLEKETRRFMRDEVYTWQVRDDRTQAEWLASGRDERCRLADEADRLLAAHQRLPWRGGPEAIADAVADKGARASFSRCVPPSQREEHTPLPQLDRDVKMRPRLTLLDRPACERLHGLSLELLQRTGIRYNSRRALELLAEAGCPVDYDTLTARIPPAVVERCLASTPRRVALASRDGRHDLVYEKDTRATEIPFRGHVMLSSQGQRAIDLESGQERPSLAEDLRRAIRLADALDAVDLVTEIVNANDRDPATGPNFSRADILANTGKHFRAMPESPTEARAVLEMGAAVAGSSRALAERPILSGLVCAVSPLSHHGPVVETGLMLAEAGLPLLIYSMPLAGATGPVSVAGMALLSNVEVLSQVVLYQIARPGLPLIYGAGGTFLDLRTAVFRGHTQETDLLGLALCDLAHWYGLPVNVNGLSTGARHLGLEAFANGARSGLVYTLAGADELFGIGLLDGAQTLSLEKLFLDAEIVRMIRAIVAGPSVEAGLPSVAHSLRSGLPSVALTVREESNSRGPVHEIDWAAGQVREIVAGHKPDPLPSGVLEELYRIAAAYRI